MAENSFLRDNFPSLYHRINGKPICLCDIDSVQMEEGSAEGMWLEYMYKNGKIRTVAYIDYKRVCKNQTTIALGKIPVYLAESEARKIPVPVFAVLTYLDPDYPVKMYLVVAICPIAKQIFTACKLPSDVWMNLRQYSQFMYAIRNLNWSKDKEQIIPEKDILNIKKYDPAAPLFVGMKLKDLPTESAIYFVPDLSKIRQ